MKSSILLPLLAVLVMAYSTSPVLGFAPQRYGTPRPFCRTLERYSSPQDREERLRSLGYSEDEIKKTSVTVPDRVEEQKVRVDLVEDIDPLTLTAVGFALIAFNFLVLGNLGDGGIGGLVATAINLMNQ